MKKPIILCFLLLPTLIQAQPAATPLGFSSYAIRMGVTKDEHIVLNTRMGEIGIGGTGPGEWRRADIPSERNHSGELLEQPIFFNKDTGFVSGFIRSPRGQYDILYHTVNGGLNWDMVNLGQGGWVDDAAGLDNGEAWLSVAGSGIAFTRDYGRNWQKFNIPEPKQRFASIFFNAERQGIIGSLWDMIAYTADNCQSWKLLPTPLDQQKYKKTNSKARPEINKVAIFNEYFLVMQENLVFYSRRDSINWIWLPDYTNFYTDADYSALFFGKGKESYVRCDKQLAVTYAFAVPGSGFDVKCKNGSLFIAANSKLIQLNPQNEVVVSSYDAIAVRGISPVYIGDVAGKSIGLLDNKIFEQQMYDGAWKYLFTFPLPLDKAKLGVTAHSLLIYDRGGDSLYYFNLFGNMVKAVFKKAMVVDFANAGIKRLVFHKGSRGCFHYYDDTLSYTHDGNVFGDATRSDANSGTDHLPGNPEEIATEDVAAFVKKIPQVFDPTQTATIADLAFTPKEYEQCRKDIRAFRVAVEKKTGKETTFHFERNNLDFSRLLSLVDSAKYLDAERLRTVLTGQGIMWSTTSNWKMVELINDREEVLRISFGYYEQNAFSFPWTVSLNGYSVSVTNMAINQFIQKVYPALLDRGGRVEVLHSIVKALY